MPRKPSKLERTALLRAVTDWDLEGRLTEYGELVFQHDHHWRLRMWNGTVIDLWPGTGRWGVQYDKTSTVLAGLHDALKVLHGQDPWQPMLDGIERHAIEDGPDDIILVEDD